MKRNILYLLLIVILPFSSCMQTNGEQTGDESKTPDYVIVIHGGAGNASEENFTDEMKSAYREKLEEALNRGIGMLESGATGIETIEQVIHIMENSPLFNAGKGAVFTHDGHNELDASIMDGKTLNAGAVAGVRNIKNPISAAIKVMNESKHVLLAGDGASLFAKEKGLEIVDSSYFFTQNRWDGLQRALKAEKNGTVGCVVLDKYGNLAAGTSTGGMTNKMYGRIGDSPIIGAGTYANNNTCAVSGTGHGEFFIRYVAAYSISTLMEYKNLSLQQAAEEVVINKLKNAGANAGIIAVDKNGNVATVFNTNMMFRGYAKSTGEKDIAIFK